MKKEKFFLHNNIPLFFIVEMFLTDMQNVSTTVFIMIVVLCVLKSFTVCTNVVDIFLI